MSTRRRMRGEQQEPDLYGWMLTFTDLMMLLLTMFVLQLAMSQVDRTALSEKLASFQERGARGDDADALRQLRIEAGTVETKRQQLVTAVADGLAQLFGRPERREEFGGELSFDGAAAVISEGDSLRVRLGSSSVVHATGELTFMGEEALRVLGAVAKEHRLSLFVAAHTDSTVPEDALAPSPWKRTELEAAQAVRQLLDAGVGEGAISAAGYGDSKPLGPNTSAVGQQRNRRLEITLASAENHSPSRLHRKLEGAGVRHGAAGFSLIDE